jgi:hypothetical protein
MTFFPSRFRFSCQDQDLLFISMEYACSFLVVQRYNIVRYANTILAQDMVDRYLRARLFASTCLPGLS